MRYYYERDSVTGVYYIIDRKYDHHIADCFSVHKAAMIVIALNEIVNWRG